jgi:pimeloyl-ACP methyl ester carboxylesterase
MILRNSKKVQTEIRLTRSWVRATRRFWAALLFPPVLITSFLYAVRWCENRLTFDPEPFIPGQAWELPKGGEEVAFFNEQRLRLRGWFINSQSQPALATVIYFHGKSGNVSGSGWLGENLAALGFNVLLFDYRGYGKSEGEITVEQDLYADAEAAYRYVVDERGIPPERLILYGHSLGTTAAADLASRRRCSAVILESGFSSMREMASAMLPWTPTWLHSLGQNSFESAKKLAEVHCPVLITHGDPDDIVPTEQGRALFSAAREPKRLMIIPGAGHNVSGYGGDIYFGELAKFIRDSSEGRMISSINPHPE